MSFQEQEEDKIVQFALTPQDYHFEYKLAQFPYIDKLEDPTDEAPYILGPQDYYFELKVACFE